jgi:hypothetical protein
MMTKTTAEEVYNHVIKPLPPSERLKLATLILNNLPPQAVVDYSEEWTDEDVHDFTAYSWNYIMKCLEEEEGSA